MRLDRRTALLSLGAGHALPNLARAQAQRRPYKIFMILFRGWEEACNGFRDYFRFRSIEVEFIVRDAEQNLARVAEFVREANETRPDLVFLWGTGTTGAALGPWNGSDNRRFLRDIPTVFAIVTNPVGTGVIRSLESPGREATGTIYVVPTDVQFRTLQTYRAAQRIASIYNPLEPNSRLVIDELKALVAAVPGGTFTDLPVRLNAAGRPDPESIAGLVEQAKRADAQWLYIPPDTFLNEHRHVLTGTALQVGLPAFSASERFVIFADALVGLVCRYYNIGAFTAFKAEQILVQRRPASSIPVETLNRFSLIVRFETAQRLRFYPPMAMVRYAESA